MRLVRPRLETTEITQLTAERERYLEVQVEAGNSFRVGSYVVAGKTRFHEVLGAIPKGDARAEKQLLDFALDNANFLA